MSRGIHLDQVVARTAFDGIVGATAESHRVVAVAAAQYIRAGTLVVDYVIAGSAVNRVVAVAVGDGIVTTTSVYGVIANTCIDRIITSGTANYIITTTWTIQNIISTLPKDINIPSHSRYCSAADVYMPIVQFCLQLRVEANFSCIFNKPVYVYSAPSK